jgi:integrase
MIRGKIHYFGRWAKRVNGKLVRIDGDGWKEALEEYKQVADDLHAGRTPRVQGDGLTVADLCNRFLTAKLRQKDAGEISSRMFADYKCTTDRLVSTFGKTRLVDDLAADDFESLRDEMAKQWGPARLGTVIQMIRTIFKYGFESGLIDRPVRYGPQFKKPSASVMRRHRAMQGPKLFTAEEVRRLIDAAGPSMKAMILLGVNCGFGNSDCGNLPLRAVDLDAGMIDFPRPKTGIARRCPLWPETVVAIRTALDKRPTPKSEEDAALVFVTKYGDSWAKEVADSPITKEMRKLLTKLGIDGQRNFYTLRHTFRTIADEAKDQPAVDFIMGHVDASMAGHYRERIDDSRLRAVVEHVRSWLFGDEPDGENESKDDAPDDPSIEEGDGSPAGEENDPRPMLRLFAG